MDPDSGAQESRADVEGAGKGRGSGGLRDRIGLYLTYLGIGGAYFGVAVALGLDPRGQFGSTWGTTLALAAVLVPLFGAVTLLTALLERPWTWSALGLRLRRRLWSPEAGERVVGIFGLLLVNMLVFDVFAAFKPAIPSFQPYVWDPALADLDRLLHFGNDPWEWLHRLPFRDPLTAILDWAYVQWYLTVTLVLSGVLLFAGMRARVLFFIGFALLWSVGGSLIGTLLASGGPVYFAEFTGDAARFDALLSYLGEAAPAATALQDLLWSAYLSVDEDVAFEGISAMPSLHVATAAYFACWGFRVGRVWGVVGALYTGLILIGSVHLAWHYAVDGYAGIALGWAFAAIPGRWIRRDPPSPSDPGRVTPGKVEDPGTPGADSTDRARDRRGG